jgi:hypothetical protein
MISTRRFKSSANASDCDNRTAAEGNVVAFKALVEFGADLTVKDSWHDTGADEAKRANGGQLLKYLETMKNGTTAELMSITM